jgi:hypothetical protein
VEPKVVHGNPKRNIENHHREGDSPKQPTTEQKVHSEGNIEKNSKSGSTVRENTNTNTNINVNTNDISANENPRINTNQNVNENQINPQLEINVAQQNTNIKIEDVKIIPDAHESSKENIFTRIFRNDGAVRRYWNIFIQYFAKAHYEILKLIPYPFDLLICVYLGYLISKILFSFKIRSKILIKYITSINRKRSQL